MGKSPEELKKIRSEAAKKAAITRKQNKIAAEEKKQQEQQKKTNSSKWDWLLWLLLVLAIVALLIWKKPWTTEAPALVSTEAPTATAEAPVVATEAPVVATEAPVVATEAPIVEATCPTTGEAQALFGVNVQRIDTEPCGWVWRGKPMSHSGTCPLGYVCSFDVVNDITVIHLGIGQSADIYAGTFRLIDVYSADDAVRNVCELYLKEKDFASREIPTFEVRFQAVPNLGPQTCPEQ